jgi:hypothetical protein
MLKMSQANFLESGISCRTRHPYKIRTAAKSSTATFTRERLAARLRAAPAIAPGRFAAARRIAVVRRAAIL